MITRRQFLQTLSKTAPLAALALVAPPLTRRQLLTPTAPAAQAFLQDRGPRHFAGATLSSPQAQQFQCLMAGELGYGLSLLSGDSLTMTRTMTTDGAERADELLPFRSTQLQDSLLIEAPDQQAAIQLVQRLQAGEGAVSFDGLNWQISRNGKSELLRYDLRRPADFPAAADDLLALLRRKLDRHLHAIPGGPTSGPTSGFRTHR